MEVINATKTGVSQPVVDAGPPATESRGGAVTAERSGATGAAERIVFYDGDCGFCSRVVIFVADRDPGRAFRFAPLESELGLTVRRNAGLSTRDVETMLLLEGGRVHTRSTAALRVAGGLRWPWPLARLLLLIPRVIRDRVYDVIARNRHRISRGDHCVLPATLEGRMVEAD